MSNTEPHAADYPVGMTRDDLFLKVKQDYPHILENDVDRWYHSTRAVEVKEKDIYVEVTPGYTIRTIGEAMYMLAAITDKNIHCKFNGINFVVGKTSNG